jgi:hypothetical protein
MYGTAPESSSTLVEFYSTVRPGGAWKPVAWKVSADSEIKKGPSTPVLLLYWLGGIAAVYGALFLVGALLFKW